MSGRHDGLLRRYKIVAQEMGIQLPAHVTTESARERVYSSTILTQGILTSAAQLGIVVPPGTTYGQLVDMIRNVRGEKSRALVARNTWRVGDVLAWKGHHWIVIPGNGDLRIRLLPVYHNGKTWVRRAAPKCNVLATTLLGAPVIDRLTSVTNLG